jgi:glycosyltransferase involved in cell wall biosynthesis
MRLVVITTHPIQYMAPWYRGLAADPSLDVEVVYFRELDRQSQGEGFGEAFAWDLPLREGYRSQVLGVGPGLRRLPGLLRRLGAAVRGARPDVALVTGWNEVGLAAAYPLLRLMGVPIIARGESNALRVRPWATRLMHRGLLRLVSAALVIGVSNRAFYLANGFPVDRLFAGAYFVESERMLVMSQHYAAERAALRQQADYSDCDFVFCFVGKHVPFKRPLLLVDAAALARSRGWPVKLLFAGSGELTEAIAERARASSVPVAFTGFLNQTELWRAYVPADAFVLPSTDRETWGLVTNEAMLFGLPVIVSDRVGCGPDLVHEGETGFRFSGGAEALADAMERLVREPAAARAMGVAGRRLVVEHYSMPTATAGLKAALESIRAAG